MAVRQLEEAMVRASSLPDERQEALAALILEEIATEERWEAQFNGSADKLAALADAALDEDARGETLPLDDSLA
jgi:hypothetical protein